MKIQITFSCGRDKTQCVGNVQYVSGMRVAEFHFLTRGLRPEHAEYTQMPTTQAKV